MGAVGWKGGRRLQGDALRRFVHAPKAQSEEAPDGKAP